MNKSNTDLKTIYERLTDTSVVSDGQGRSAPLKEFTRSIRLLTHTHTCILTFVDEIGEDRHQVFRVASSSQDQKFEEVLDEKRRIPLRADDDGSGVHLDIAVRGTEYESDTLQKDGGKVSNPEVMKKFGLNYVYCYPIKVDKKLKGYLNFFSPEKEPFSDDLKCLIRIAAAFAEVPVHQYDIQNTRNQILKDAIEKMAEVTGENLRDKILRIALKHAVKLLDKENIFASVLKLDEKTGTLVEIEAIPRVDPGLNSIPLGEGYCNYALNNEKNVLFKNIKSRDWTQRFLDAWGRGTKSEMIVPLLIKNKKVRVRKSEEFAIRPLGVLNFESPNRNEFTDDDFSALLPLISQTSLLIEKLEIERKLSDFRGKIEKKVLPMQNLAEVLKILAEGIRDVLGFEFVDISIVDDSKKIIETKEVVGIEGEKAQRFRKMASHSLNSDDIQASVVRSREIEVPDENDARFDRNIWDEFGHKDLIRVFFPVISSSTNKCVGTIEAGYRRDFRKYIYESDVQFLYQFGELIVAALEKQQNRIMDRISHELRSPVAGILGNIDRLKIHHRDWEKWFVDVKLEDIELDCDILKHNILELEYFLGRPFPKIQISDRPVAVMKEIVLKTIKSLKPVILDEGYDFDIESCVNKDDLDKINIYTDKIKLGQVFFNLVTNSIRYANRRYTRFRLKVIADTETDKEFFIIKFQDWGIGIREEYREKVFDEQFRSPEAKTQFVSGTGLGLTISRSIMRNDIKGDLVLVHCSDPTEFAVKIPKRYVKRPHSI